DGEIINIVDRNGRLQASQYARDRWSHGNGLKGRFLLPRRQVAQSAIQPSVLCRFDTRRARLHEILRVEVRAVGIGRTGGVHDRQLTLLPERLERRKRRVQAEEAV